MFLWAFGAATASLRTLHCAIKNSNGNGKTEDGRKIKLQKCADRRLGNRRHMGIGDLCDNSLTLREVIIDCRNGSTLLMIRGRQMDTNWLSHVGCTDHDLWVGNGFGLPKT